MNLPKILNSFLVSVAIYPVVLVGVWLLFALGVLAADLKVPTDTMPLVYGLAFAVMTVALIDLLGIASVVMGLVAIANLIEYAQMLVPGRSASPVDFAAGLAGVIFAAILVWSARSFVQRMEIDDPDDPDITTDPKEYFKRKVAKDSA
ncbi:MAG: hypothetical protein AAGP08_00665 [Pseudomonadota bacterium]